MFELEGFIKTITEVEQITEKFSKVTVVLTDNKDKYPSHVPFEFTNDSIDMLSGFAEGIKVRIKFFINGREWKDRHFVSLRAASIELVGNAAAPKISPPLKASDVKITSPNPSALSDNDDDDLPF